MHFKSTKKLRYSATKVGKSFTSEKLTAYTSNGIVDFMKQTLASLPSTVQKNFFRAGSGFFNGQLFDLLEENGHEYLVKAKLTNCLLCTLKYPVPTFE